jgi:prepilin-type N-terminal cleavage/methylation domain-containing protein
MSAQGSPATEDEKRGGFTLFETLVVLVILGLAMSISAYALWARPAATDPNLLAGRIRLVLHSAYMRALVSGNTTSVRFDLQSGLVSDDFDDTTIEIPNNIEIALLVGRELIDPDGDVSVHFYGQGGSTGLRIELSNSEDRRSVLETNWLTGATQIVEQGR